MSLNYETGLQREICRAEERFDRASGRRKEEALQDLRDQEEQLRQWQLPASRRERILEALCHRGGASSAAVTTLLGNLSAEALLIVEEGLG